MARVILSREEQTQLNDTKADILELSDQIQAGIDGGVVAPAMLAAVNEQLTQINVLMDNFT